MEKENGFFFFFLPFQARLLLSFVPLAFLFPWSALPSPPTSSALLRLLRRDLRLLRLLRRDLPLASAAARPKLGLNSARLSPRLPASAPPQLALSSALSSCRPSPQPTSSSARLQGSDGGEKLYWGIAGDGSVVICDDKEVIKAGCAKSYAPFPKGCMFHSEGGLMSFEHPMNKMKAMPRVDSEGVMCGANFKVDEFTRVNSIPRRGSESNWMEWDSH